MPDADYNSGDQPPMWFYIGGFVVFLVIIFLMRGC